MEDLYNKASLVLTPQMVETGKVYSMKPEDRKGDFTFSRSTAATRVNASGNIEKETQNLLVQSNNFGTTWTIFDSTLASGQADKDGGTSAWKFTNNSPYGRVTQDVTSSGVNTFSIYAKQGNNPYLRMQFQPVGHDAYFDLSDGSVISAEATIIDAGTEYVGNGWYRVFASVNQTIDNVRIVHTGAGGAGGGSTGDYFYLQDAQLEQGLAARDYIETTTTAIYGGITDNVPRLDYTDSSCPSLLLEPQRTNDVTHSEYLDAYAKTRVVFVQNATASPEGVVNAVEFNDTATSGTHFFVAAGTQTNGAVLSFFAKQNTHRYVQAGPASSIAQRVFFDLQDGVMATIGGSAESYYGIEDYGNGWYRCYIEVANNENCSIFTASGDGSSFSHNNYTGDGSGVYLYGVQVEANVSYHTSYIPTYGSVVTRENDLFELRNVQTNGLVTSTQGTMFFHITDIAGTAVVYNIQTLNDLSYALRFVVKDNGFTTYQRVNNVQTLLRGDNLLSLSEWKIAMSWNGTSLITSLNGTSYIDTIDASIASQLDKIARVNPQAISATTNQILVFPTQLTEAELNALTTI